MKRNNMMVFDLIWYEAIKELPEYERRGMYEAIFEYALSGKQPEELIGSSLALWKVICDRIPDPTDDEQSGTETEEDKE